MTQLTRAQAHMVKYAVMPGYIRSKNDGDTHYVGVTQLVRLYRLRRGEWVSGELSREYKGLIALYPDYDGLYELPTT